MIHQPEEEKWVKLQAYTSKGSIHLLYPTQEGAPPLPNKALKETKQLELQAHQCSWTLIEEIDPNQLLVVEETIYRNTIFVVNSYEQRDT